MYITVRPAYGRDYKTAKAVKADYEAGKDFVIVEFGHDYGRYINKDDHAKGTTLNVRYDRDRKVLPITKK